MSDIAPPQRPRWIPVMLAVLMGPVLLLGGPSLVASFPALARRAAAADAHRLDLALLVAQPVALKLHIVAVAGAAVLGVAMMVSRKGRRFHRVAGWTWAALVLVGAVTPIWLAISAQRLSLIYLTIPFTLVLLAAGVAAARRHDVARHRRCMLWLYYGPVIGAGAMTFLPGRLMWRLFFG